VTDQPRSSQRYQSRPRDEDRVLVAKMLGLVRHHPRFGYRRVWALLRAEGFNLNRKRVHRLWKKEGLKVPVKQRKKRRLGTSANGIMRQRALHKDHIWA
jgi:putative transposase